MRFSRLFRLSWLPLMAFLLAACSGEADVERRALALDIAESIVTPEGFERVGEIAVEDPGFGLFGASAGSVIHEWNPLESTTTTETFEAFDLAILEAGYQRVTVLCNEDDLAAIYWHPETGSGLLDRQTDDGVISIGLSSSWSNDRPTDEVGSTGPQDCSGE